MSHISVNFLVVGDTGVGKSSIIASFFGEKIQPIHLPTHVLSASHCTFAFSSKEVEAYICDLPGSEHFRPIVSCFYPGAAAILLVFDLINKHTFNNLPRWMHDIRETLPAHSVVVLIGNKSDLEKARVVSRAEAQIFADRFHLRYFEVSAALGLNVGLAFDVAAGLVLDKVEERDGATSEEDKAVSSCDMGEEERLIWKKLM
ncbi:Ras-like protein Rab-2A [Penaeus vannamei]|uniref:Ras-like protein Rab-2A n=1 Tax=Penaeus vannamei TaxID=6689 RepID=A0A423T378_PENVA|nr:ras-related protein Rab-2A-like [Penaeus vannamei]ROT70982.1 Ras-like protein Rab-2A [Penaeus vannamei]